MFPQNITENGEPELQNKRGRLTTLCDNSEAEKGEPQLQNKRGTNLFVWRSSAMKKLLSIALILVIVFSFTVPAMAAEEVSLRKAEDDWYIDVTNGYTGTVTYKDNKQTYSYDVNGNGSYFIGLQRDFTGQLTLVGTYGSAPEGPAIIGTRTITTTTFDGYVASIGFLANQKNQQGPNANYITAVITETYTVVIEVYDVWSNGDQTLNETSSYTYSETIEGKSNALPNGSASNLVPSFEGGLSGYSVVVSYNGNGNKFSWSIKNAPEREPVRVDSGIVLY